MDHIYSELCFRITEKDLYLSKDYQSELEQRLESKLSQLQLPLIFLNGEFLGVSYTLFKTEYI